VSGNASQSQDWKEIIRKEWIDAAPFWKKWGAKLSFQSRAATDLVVHGAQVRPGMNVLDLASGAGEPSLSLAIAVGPQGHVVATDLVPEMLQTAQENAKARSIANLEFKAADAEDLPFADDTFDRVTARFGIMFFPQIEKALMEQRRVLKPGGRVSFVTWGPPEENPLFGVMLGPFLKYVKVPPPPADGPHIFRFSDPAKVADVLVTAGFKEVDAKKHQVVWPWPGPPEEAWEATREIAAPFRKMIAALPSEKTEEVTQEVVEGIRKYFDGQTVNFPASLVASTAIA
jgi:ubiquinone/menaquinone biosynthesis C-methylase UbiE